MKIRIFPQTLKKTNPSNVEKCPKPHKHTKSRNAGARGQEGNPNRGCARPTSPHCACPAKANNALERKSLINIALRGSLGAASGSEGELARVLLTQRPASQWLARDLQTPANTPSKNSTSSTTRASTTSRASSSSNTKSFPNLGSALASWGIGRESAAQTRVLPIRGKKKERRKERARVVDTRKRDLGAILTGTARIHT